MSEPDILKVIVTATRNTLSKCGWGFFEIECMNPDDIIKNKFKSFITMNETILKQHQFGVETTLECSIFGLTPLKDITEDTKILTVFLPRCACILSTLRECYHLKVTPLIS